MNKTFNPTTVAAGVGYSHGVELPANSRVLYLAGQVGAAPDGTVATLLRPWKMRGTSAPCARAIQAD